MLRLFCEDLTAVQLSNLIITNRNSVNRLLTLFRFRVVEWTRAESSFKGTVEDDESFFITFEGDGVQLH